MPGICWALFILILSTVSVPPVDVPDIFDLGPDKIVHVIFYMVQTFLLARATVSHLLKKDMPVLIAAFISALYGGLIELYQGFVLSNRTADFGDMIANITGAAIGGLIFSHYRKDKG